jgi:outer membrane protein OmpA-like peptidoglycan-associated protein
MKQLFNRGGVESEDYWISISDLMTGLMVIFLFIALSYMIDTRKANEDIKRIATTYLENHDEIYQALLNEFQTDLPRWNAEIDSVSLIVRFKEPEVLFQAGQADLQDKFKTILVDFFPRYINVLTVDRFKENIKEIRIEGHTSSEWNREVTSEEAYLKNMQLSQHRVSEVLLFVLGLSWENGLADWIRKNVVSNGYSSSRLVLKNDLTEDRDRSRRVEFRVETNADKKIVEIINRGGWQ